MSSPHSTRIRRLHWWTVGLVALNLPLGLCQISVPDGAMGDALLRMHLVVGLAVLGLSAARLAVVVRGGEPEPAPTLSPVARARVRAVHVTMIVVLALLTASGVAIWLIAGLPLNPLSATRDAVEGTSAATWVHRSLAVVLCGLAAAHIAGVVLHDATNPGTLSRMRRPQPTPQGEPA